MLEKLLTYLRINKATHHRSILDQLRERFFNNPHHDWIINDKYYQRAFEVLLESFDQSTINFFLNSHKRLTFIQGSGKLSCAITASEKHYTIIIFPDLQKLLKSASPSHGIAVLAHEIGHIIHNHSEKQMDLLEAQIEADSFAYDLGFGNELQDILLDYPSSIDCKVRISRLTSKILTENSEQ